jgi:hypothetical protein
MRPFSHFVTALHDSRQIKTNKKHISGKKNQQS